MSCHYELIYTVEEARTQRLALLLPKSTPASLSIAALDGVKLKEFGSEIVGRQRRWNVLLAEPQRGRVRLAVDFQQPLPSQEPKGFALPLVAGRRRGLSVGPGGRRGLRGIGGAGRHAGPPVDVGELAEADYQPGRRLLGAFGFVGDPPAVKIDVLRHPGYRHLSGDRRAVRAGHEPLARGQSQTQARFKLRTKAVYLQVKLPAGAELWSAELDGVPLKPQREGDSVLVDVPAGKADAAQTLQIVYAAPVERGGAARHGRRAGPEAVAPRRAGQGGGRSAAGRSGVAAAPAQRIRSGPRRRHGRHRRHQRPLPAAVEVAGILYYLTGGISGPPLLLPAVQAAREAARRMQVQLMNRSARQSAELRRTIGRAGAEGGDSRQAQDRSGKRMTSPLSQGSDERKYAEAGKDLQTWPKRPREACWACAA